MKRTTILLIVVTLLLLAAKVLAMSSDNYRLDWFTPLTGGGGGAADSAHYSVNFTVGQSAIGTSDSTSYEGCLGYWCRSAVAEVEYGIYLPIILKNYP
jgi:hypothetical protein